MGYEVRFFRVRAGSINQKAAATGPAVKMITAKKIIRKRGWVSGEDVRGGGEGRAKGEERGAEDEKKQRKERMKQAE